MPLPNRMQWRIRQVRKRLRWQSVKAESKARWYFRHASSIGKMPYVVGNPIVTTPKISIGDEFLLWSTYRQTCLGGEGDGELIMGDRIFINTGAVILAYDRITFEDDVGIASEVFISDSDNHPLADREMNQGPIHIGEGAWVATRAMIMPGVTIGARAVIAAGSVVTKDVPAETLVAGVPARPIRKIEYPPGKRTAWKPT